MEVQNQNEVKTSKAVEAVKRVAMATGVVLATTGMAFAEGEGGGVQIDLTTGLAGVAIIAGLMAAGGLKALPTYAGWGIKKALAMLR